MNKIIKIIKFRLDNNDNHTNLRIQCENTKTINQGNHRISNENQENHEIIELHSLIM